MVQGNTVTLRLKVTAVVGPFNSYHEVTSTYTDSLYGQLTIPVSPSGMQHLQLGAGQSTHLNVSVGPFPSYVDNGTFSLTFAASPDTHDVANIQVFDLYASPSAPQSAPWYGVLQNACSWAAGDNSILTVARDVTLGEYFSERFAYTPASNWTDPNNPETFRLSKFLQSSGYQAGNCVDVSDYYSICVNAVGLSATVSQCTDSGGNGFLTNGICAIGSDPTNSNNYVPWTWGFHQIATENGSTYDACAAQYQNLSGAGYENPPF